MKITFPDGSVKEHKNGSTALDIAMTISEGLARASVVAKINGVLQDLNLPINKDCKLELLKFESKEGKDVFWHSSTHLMAHAVIELFPEAKLTIGPVIENGFYYDFDHPPFEEKDLEKIETKMKEIVERKLEVKGMELSKSEALKLFKDNYYKTEIIKQVPEDETITAYKQGDFIDLCRGPHLPNTSKIKAFKLTKISGAYWRGDSNNAQLQRIYGISFPSKDELKDYLKQMEEAEKRDHRKIGKDLDLFSTNIVSPGSTFFHPKGMVIYNELMKFLREEYFKRNYSEVLTPIMFNKSLWETSGHWEHYQNNMFLTESEGNTFSLKPMNCPGHTVIYSSQTRSYRNLPLRLAEFGQLHRNELSGTLAGLTRVRRFVTDDCHIFCTPDQIQNEIEKELEFANFVLGKTFDFSYKVELSTKPEKAVGSAEIWKKAEEGLRKALEKNNIEYKLNPGDGAFYGPKIDFHITDALGRTWQCATIQLDFNMPERFDLNFEGEDGKKHRPVMIHRAMLGSIERFMGVLIEHCAGKFPLWLSPVQVILLPIADRHIDFCEDVASEMKEKGIRVEIDGSRETLNKKVREAQLQQINYILVVGDKEQESKTVNVRTRDNEVKGEKVISKFVEEVLNEIKSRK